jgi:hypothetical protein
MSKEKPLYTLNPLEVFKSILGIDDRDDKIARFCLVTSTFSIEQYCKRRFLRKKYIERIEYTGDIILPLKEYPVTNLLAVYAISNKNRTGEIVEPDFFYVIPDYGTDDDIPFCLSLSPALQRYRGLLAFKAVYWAGYAHNKIPADLATACLELASWNMNRYRGRRIGMTGNVRGSGRDREHFEMSMPENVKILLEPYRRKTI